MQYATLISNDNTFYDMPSVQRKEDGKGCVGRALDLMIEMLVIFLFLLLIYLT